MSIVQVLQEVVRLTNPQVQQCMIDFEEAEWVASPLVLPNVELIGCYFHWKKAVWEKIDDNKLKVSYLSTI